MRKFSHPIVCVSNSAWNADLPTNRQQLPPRFADHTQVLYVSPFSLGRVLLGRQSLWAYHPRLLQVKPGLYVFSCLQLLTMVRGQIWPLKQFDSRLRTVLIQHQMRFLRFERPILWLYFPPDFSHLKGKLGESLVCYHCTDDFVGYAATLGWDVERIRREETALIQQADVIIVTSRPLYEKHVQLNRNVHLVPNAGNVPLFQAVAKGEVNPASELASLNRPVVGFVGAVDRYKLDLTLIEGVADVLPDWSFVFVGPVGSQDGTTLEDLPRRTNIHYLGIKPHHVLPSYVAGFDVCTIPYQLNSYTRGVFPLKLWEYLAAGKPVVSTPLPALRDYEGCVTMVDSVEAFAMALEEARKNAYSEDAVQARVALALSNSWERRAEEILEILARYL